MAKVQFNCSCGVFTAEIIPDWAPRGADRFMELLESDFFPGVRFFRVVKKPRPFVVQFGIHGDPAVSAHWRNKAIPDDPVKQSNTAGTITFATSGPNSRTTQFFINLADNTFLDNQGFSPIGRVIEGMDAVNAICGDYGEKPDQSRIQRLGNVYLEDEFPKMDYIESVTLIEE